MSCFIISFSSLISLSPVSFSVGSIEDADEGKFVETACENDKDGLTILLDKLFLVGCAGIASSNFAGGVLFLSLSNLYILHPL